MYTILSLLIFLFSLILHFSFLSHFSVISLLLILVVLWGLLFGFKKTFWLAIIFGFCLDLGGKYFGFYMFSFLILGFLADILINRIFIKNYVLPLIFLVILGTVLLNVMPALVFLKSFPPQLLFNFLSAGLLNLILAFLLFPLARRLQEKIAFYERKVKLPL